MEKIDFINNSTPALNATNLNKLQDNTEDAIEDAKEELQNEIPTDIATALQGDYKSGNVVVDSIRSKNLSTKNNDFTVVNYVIADFRVEKLSAGTTYTVSYYTDKSSQITNWYFKDANKNNVTNIGRTNTTTRSSFQITPTVDIYYIGAWANDPTVKIFDFQIEEGDAVTTYAPFQDLSPKLEPITITPNTTYITSVGNVNVYVYGSICMVSLNVQLASSIPNGAVLFTGLPKTKPSYFSFLGASVGAAYRLYVHNTQIQADGAISTGGWMNATVCYPIE